MTDSHLVFGFISLVIGMVISLAMHVILYQIDLLVSWKKNQESLEDHVKKLDTIVEWSEDLDKTKSSSRAVNEWVEKLRTLRRKASQLLPADCTIQSLRVVSRYQTSKTITKINSDIDKQLKYVPLILSEFLLRQLKTIQTLKKSLRTKKKQGRRLMQSAMGAVAVAGLHILVHEFIGKGAKLAIHQILRSITIMFRLKTELASLKDLVTSVRPFFTEIQQICPSNRWCPESFELLEKADKIEFVPWWNVIRRYKKSKEITTLISEIMAHVESASVVNLGLILMGIREMESLEEKVETSAEEEV